jgi:hypothetical protein
MLQCMSPNVAHASVSASQWYVGFWGSTGLITPGREPTRPKTVIGQRLMLNSEVPFAPSGMLN